MGEDTLEGVRDDGSKIEVTERENQGESSQTGKDLMSSGKTQTPESPISTSKFGDPMGMTSPTVAPLQHLAAGKIDMGFYGHTLPSHFKKTSIIGTTGRLK